MINGRINESISACAEEQRAGETQKVEGEEELLMGFGRAASLGEEKISMQVGKFLYPKTRKRRWKTKIEYGKRRKRKKYPFQPHYFLFSFSSPYFN